MTFWIVLAVWYFVAGWVLRYTPIVAMFAPQIPGDMDECAMFMLWALSPLIVPALAIFAVFALVVVLPIGRLLTPPTKEGQE